VQIKPDHLFQGHKARFLALARQPHKTAQLRRNRQQRVDVLAVALTCQLQCKRKCEIGNERKRVRRIERERRQNRKNLFAELRVEPGAIRIRQFLRFQNRNPGIAQFDTQGRPHFLLVADQIRRQLVDPDDLLGRRQAVFAGRSDFRRDHAFQAGDPHHVEFIEVRRRNRHKPKPLQQGMARVLGLFEHPPIEGEPGQFPVDKASGRIGGDGKGYAGFRVERQGCRRIGVRKILKARPVFRHRTQLGGFAAGR